MKYKIVVLLLLVLFGAFLFNVKEFNNLEVSASSQALDGFTVQSVPWGDWTHYHNYTEIVATLHYVNDTYPGCVDMFSIGRSWLDQEIYCVRLTNESDFRAKPEVFFVSYHHARELITAELALYFIVEAASNFGVNSTLTRLLNSSEIYIIPALNTDGFEAMELNEWQRKNVHPTNEDGDLLSDEDPPDDEDDDGYIEGLYQWNGYEWVFIRWEGVDDDSDGSYNEDWVGGVDLNRNYGYQWDASTSSGSTDPRDEDYKGTAPFSEPETQVLRDFVMQHDFKYAISYHSGIELIIYPWGYTGTPTPDDATFIEVASELSDIVGAPYGQSGDGLYTASGLWDDWMYGNQSVMALTCEIWRNSSAWQYDDGPLPNSVWERGIFEFFNPMPAQIEPVVQRWLPTFTYLVNRTIVENPVADHDVAVSDLTCSKTVVGEGYSTNVTATLDNQGSHGETFNITFYANNTELASATVTLTVGESLDVTFVWNTTGWQRGFYNVTAEADHLDGEVDTDDNSFTYSPIVVTVPGDVEGDRKCDLIDIFQLILSFGCEAGQPCYINNYDVNDDGKIDLMDIFIAILNYGVEW